jgi:ligand-binding SRPBCC domain-containing protein
VAVIDITTDIRAPIQRVFDLSRSVDLHTASTSQTGERAVPGVTSGLMQLGDYVTWRARHFGIWQQLTTRITVFEPPSYFRDSMVDGAFKRFDHDHFFSARGEFTQMRDVFAFDSPLGILGDIADRLFLAGYVRRFLDGRNALIKTVAETDRWRDYLQQT